MELTAETIQFLFANADALVGFILPPLIDFLNREVPTSKGRFFVTILTTVGVTAFLNWDHIAYGNPELFLSSAALIFTESQVVYKMYFEDSYIRSKLQTKIDKPSPLPDVEELEKTGL